MKLYLIVVFSAVSLTSSSQAINLKAKDSLKAINKGALETLIRYYYSSTDNTKNYTDYFANGIAAGLKYQSKMYKKFQFTTSSHFIYNIYSSDFTVPDVQTGQVNRYDIGLFDVSNPGRKNLFRVEEFNIKFQSKKVVAKFGRQLLNTPFINLQDGRLRPTAIEGLWSNFSSKKIKINFGYFYAIAPRSTAKWYSIGNSFGLYPQGVNQLGTAGNYYGNISSKSIILTSLEIKPTEKIQIQLWNQHINNVSNTTLLQTDFEYKINKKEKFIVGTQFIKQFTINNGGNVDASKTYLQKNQEAFIFSSKIGYKKTNWETSINYTKISKQGQYLMPREWGKDPFYTFMPRERNEGFGNVDALVVRIVYSKPNSKFKSEVSFGNFNLPDARNATLNKYPMPSYQQLNIDLRYNFSKWINALEGQFLFVRKFATGNTYNNGKFIINKVDMSIINLILNYKFKFYPHTR